MIVCFVDCFGRFLFGWLFCWVRIVLVGCLLGLLVVWLGVLVGWILGGLMCYFGCLFSW